MADTEEDTELDEVEDGEEGSEEAPAKKKLSGKTIVLFICLPILVLAIGGGAGYYFFFAGGDEQEMAEGEHAEGADQGEQLVFYDLPEMLVNLNTGGRGNTYLKLKVAIELEDESSIELIEPVLPRVIDRFQVYLRELRVADLNGSAGMFHLKTELLRRINAAVPVEVKDVLFKEMIVQ